MMNTTHAPQFHPYDQAAPTPRYLRLAQPYLAIVPIAMGAILMSPFFPDGEGGVPHRFVFMAMIPFGAAFGYVIQLLDRQTWK